MAKVREHPTHCDGRHMIPVTQRSWRRLFRRTPAWRCYVCGQTVPMKEDR